MTRLSIHARQAGAVTVLDLEGNLTFADCNGVLRDAVRRQIDQGNKKLLIHFADVALIDSSGIGELVGSYTTAIQSGGHFKLLNPVGIVREVLTRTKMLSVFQAFDDEAKAVESY
jgi:anti-sigma B factor antagonist